MKKRATCCGHERVKSLAEIAAEPVTVRAYIKRGSAYEVEDAVERVESVRAACRRKMRIDGANAQALEHALTLTERERDAALALAEQRRDYAREQNARLSVECDDLRERVATVAADCLDAAAALCDGGVAVGRRPQDVMREWAERHRACPSGRQA